MNYNDNVPPRNHPDANARNDAEGMRGIMNSEANIPRGPSPSNNYDPFASLDMQRAQEDKMLIE